VFTFGAPVEVDHRYVLKGDGTFETVQRYRGQDGAWKEQRVVGQWIARRGSAAGLCDVTMKMRGEWGEASSNSTYRLTAPGRFRFEDADFDMVRASP
jgi:hypothetical protein